MEKPTGSDHARKKGVSGKFERSDILSAALVFGLGTLISRVLGLLRDMITARYFPLDVRDAFFNAFRLPNLFRRILGEGALSASFIPIFVEVVSRPTQGNSISRSEAEMQAQRLVGAVFSILISVTVTLSLFAIVFMPQIIGALLSGDAYMSVPGKFELTVRLARIMFSFLVLVSLYAFFMAILNSLKKFALTALAPALFNTSLIAAVLVSTDFAAPAEVLAWAVLAGGVLQLLILVPSVVKSGYFPRPTLAWDSPEVKRMISAVLPALLGLSVIQLTMLVNLYFASYLPAGSHTYIYLADRILEFPLSLVVVSIGSALLPTLSKHWADGNEDAMADAVNHYVRLVFFIAIPAALGMFVLAQPMSEILFMGGEFKYEDSLQTGQVIQVYAFGLIALGGVRILAQGFYAIQNTWFPALAALVALVSHVILAYGLTSEFGLMGLAAATVGSAVVNFVMLAVGYNAWVSALKLRRLMVSILKFLACGAVMVGSLQVYESIQFVLGGGDLQRAIVLLAMIAFAALVYMTCAHFLRVPEYHETLAAFREKLARRRD